MSSFIDEMFERASADPRRIVLPEGDDPRTLEAAQDVLKRAVATPIILGDPDAIAASGFELSGAQIVDIATNPRRDAYIADFLELRRHKGITEEDARTAMSDPLYFGCMMVRSGDADGMVGGATHPTADMLRSALQVVRCAPNVKAVSSFFVMVVPDCSFGDAGTFVFADCGLTRQPDAAALADIAVASARSFRIMTGSEPKVAMLSHSSLGSAVASPERDKVIEATKIARESAPDLAIDGEMQLDCAIVPDVAAAKAPASDVAGAANVLIFPDLDAGNIGYKLVQRLAKAEAYGPITQGLAAPVNDLSRGCSAADIAGVIAITVVQAQNGTR